MDFEIYSVSGLGKEKYSVEHRVRFLYIPFILYWSASWYWSDGSMEHMSGYNETEAAIKLNQIKRDFLIKHQWKKSTSEVVATSEVST